MAASWKRGNVMSSTPSVAPTGFQPVTDELLQQVTRCIVDALAPERVILFGSYAYGEPTPDSDVDLLIVIETEERPSKRRRAVSRLFRERPFPMDIVVRTPAEVERSRERVDPFMREILDKGRVLYEQPGNA
jgi:predicted nucleotidyltransferase